MDTRPEAEVVIELTQKDVDLKTLGDMMAAIDFAEEVFASIPADKLDFAIGALLNRIRDIVHKRNVAKGWWHDKAGNDMLDPNYDQEKFAFLIGTKMALLMSEGAEQLEGFRTDAMDDKVSTRTQAEVEGVDVFLRLFDIAGALKHDIGGAYVDKVAVNAVRKDHDPSVRSQKGGKKF